MVFTFVPLPVNAVVGAATPAISVAKKSDEEKAAEKAAKGAEKAAKEAAKQAEKATKEAQKAAEQAAKEAEKAAQDAEKAADKAAKDAAKDSSRQAQAGVSAAAAVRLIAEYTEDDIKKEIRSAQRETRETFQELKKETQSEFAVAKKEARAAYKQALAAADGADSKAERKSLREQAREVYDAAKRRNRTQYLEGLEDARLYKGKAQLIFFDPGIAEVGEYDDPFAVAAVATSGLPVEISTTTPQTCSIADGFVTPVAAGSCVLLASQDGNSTYAPASTEAVVEISDQPDPQTISFAGLPTLQVGSSEQSLTAEASSGLPVTFTTQTPEVCIVSGSTLVPVSSGTCQITASQPGDEKWQPTFASTNVEVRPSLEIPFSAFE